MCGNIHSKRVDTDPRIKAKCPGCGTVLSLDQVIPKLRRKTFFLEQGCRLSPRCPVQDGDAAGVRLLQVLLSLLFIFHEGKKTPGDFSCFPRRSRYPRRFPRWRRREKELQVPSPPSRRQKAAFSLREKKSNNNNNNNIKMKIATVFPPSSVHYPHFKYFRSAKGGTSRRYGSFGSRSRTHTQTHPQQKALFNLPRDGGLLHKTGEDGQRPDRALRGPSERPAEATDSSDIITRVTPHARLFAAHTIVKPMYK